MLLTAFENPWMMVIHPVFVPQIAEFCLDPYRCRTSYCSDKKDLDICDLT